MTESLPTTFLVLSFPNLKLTLDLSPFSLHHLFLFVPCFALKLNFESC